MSKTHKFVNKLIKLYMNSNRTKQILLPACPPAFFLSLTPEQQKQLTGLLNAYKRCYADYYYFSGEMIRINGFVTELFERKLYQDVIKPKLVTPNMWRIILLMWAMQRSYKYKNVYITRELIKRESLTFGQVCRLDAYRMLRYLHKYGWVAYNKMRNNKRQFYLTEKSMQLIIEYTMRYQNAFNSFFQALSL